MVAIGIELEEYEDEEEIEFDGTITAIVDDVSFELLLEDCTTVTILTDDTSGLAVDDEVEVEVEEDIDGNLVAIGIELEEDDIEKLGILEIEDESKLKVQAKIIGDQSRVKVKKEFSTLTTDRTSLIDEIIAEFALSRDDAEAALKLETEEDEDLSERFRVKARVDDGVTEVKVELKFVLDTTDRDIILDAIVTMTQLSSDQIEGVLDFEPEEYEEEEYEIEVEVKKGKAKVKIELDDEKYRFVIKDNPTEEEIISIIVDKTGLEASFITSIWEFEYEEAEEEEEELSIEKQAKLAEKIAKHQLKAQEKAEETILKLQQKIDQLEQRLQKLLDKFEAGEYFGTISEPDPVTTSYIISFDGSATSLNDDSVVTDVDGEIFLETQVTRSDTTKFRVTGGEILVGDTFYDFVIGKARVSSSGTSGEKDSLLILGQVMDDQGNVNTIKIFVHAANSLSGDFGLEPIDLEIKMPQSKIAKHWSLSASGQLSLLQA